MKNKGKHERQTEKKGASMVAKQEGSAGGDARISNPSGLSYH